LNLITLIMLYNKNTNS